MPYALNAIPAVAVRPGVVVKPGVSSTRLTKQAPVLREAMARAQQDQGEGKTPALSPLIVIGGVLGIGFLAYRMFR